MATTKKPGTTRQWLISKIDEFIALNPHYDDESFGWKAVKDASLVGRLRSGKDITTRKLDDIIAFLGGNHKPE